MTRLLSLFTLLLLGAALSAQTVIIDHEAPATTTNFQYFGSTLEPGLNEVIANPNPTGVNTSAMVGQFDKPANSMVWAGGFTNPDPAVPVNLVGATQVCVDVHMDHIGNLALKLENSTTGGGNWVRTVENTIINDWETLCFDVTMPSIEDPMTPAVENVYPRVVLFFDFQMAFDTANVYYFDNIVSDGVAGSTVNITFNVGTSNITVSDEGLFIAGGGNFGEPGDNELTDPDGDGIYSITLARSTGFSSNYTFTNGACADFSCKEDLTGLPCADAGNFNDRFFSAITHDTVISTCFAQCTDVATDCGDGGGGGDMVSITFNLGTSDITVSDEGVFIAGGARFGAPGDNPLTDDDGDGIYSLTIMRPAGFSSNYTFTNGACGDFSCKEDIGGLPCADADNFNDRFLPAVMNDTIISTCFAQCTDVATGCGDGGGGDDMVSITFNLGTSAINVSDQGVFIAGGARFGAPGDNPLTDDDGDGVYSLTIMRPAGFSSHYTFTNGACGDFSCKEDIGGQACADAANFNDRFLPAVANDTIISTCFGQCTDDTMCGAPLDNGNITFSVNMSDYAADFDTVFVAGPFTQWEMNPVAMSDEDGDKIWTVTLPIDGGITRFKYQLDRGMVWEDFGGMAGDCNVQNGEFIDRAMTVNGDAVLETVCFNTCTVCAVSTRDLDAYGIGFSLRPTLATDQVYIDLAQGNNMTSDLQLIAADGRLLRTLRITGESRQDLDVSGLAAGAYFVRVRHGNAVGVRRFIKQ